MCKITTLPADHGGSKTIFPLPQCSAPPGCDATSASLHLVNGAVRPLNELNSGSTGEKFSAAPRSPAQHSCVARLADQCRRFQDATPWGTDRECFNAICAGVDFRGNASTFQPLDLSLISLRPERTEPKTLESMLGPSGKSVVQGFLDTCLLPSEGSRPATH